MIAVLVIRRVHHLRYVLCGVKLMRGVQSIHYDNNTGLSYIHPVRFVLPLIDGDTGLRVSLRTRAATGDLSDLQGDEGEV